MSKCKSPLWSHHGNSFNQTYKFEQKDVYTVEWLQFYSLVTGLKNFHFFTTHVEWPKTLFVLSGLIYIYILLLSETVLNNFIGRHRKQVSLTESLFKNTVPHILFIFQLSMPSYANMETSYLKTKNWVVAVRSWHSGGRVWHWLDFQRSFQRSTNLWLALKSRDTFETLRVTCLTTF